MATPIATGALKPRTAVAIAAVLNLIGAFLSTEVAKTISGGLLTEGEGASVSAGIVFAGLIGAIVWNLTTWYLGLPSSSSHALFGGLVGAAIVGAGFGAVDYGVLLGKVIIPAVLAPFTAALVAFAATRAAYAITRRQNEPDGRRVFRVGQIFSSSLVALAHGTNDAQKTMGVITLTLVAAGLQPAGSRPELWVVVACALAIALGTYSGGWRIIKTLGTGLTAVKPAQGFAAEVSTAATILSSSTVGFALSTTHVASGSVIGSGLGRRRREVRWGTARRIVTGWLFTLPGAAVVGAIAALIAGLGVAGIVIDALLGVGFMVAVFLRARPERVDASSLEAEVAAAGAVVRKRRETRS
ncbi:inorganic phosphate transporter [Amnibacterium setariae]|uniref:Inorganic phosphate transporter n=2 Tax=Amnibacterium setariae TaxID=2306585 RepID=A0A3A1TYG6_9MICO|nr:inorganic phosphate transporter [Amnibacterium setariae]